MNVAVEAPAGTVTDEGVVSNADVSDNATINPPAAAGLESVTMQAVLALEPRLAGVHCRFVVPAGAVTATEALTEEPFSDAVIVAA